MPEMGVCGCVVCSCGMEDAIQYQNDYVMQIVTGSLYGSYA